MAIITYKHHGVTVFVDEALKGKHREHCLCFKCGSFRPGTDGNCRMAQRLYRLCVEENLAAPVFECPAYVGSRFSATCTMKSVPSPVAASLASNDLHADYDYE